MLRAKSTQNSLLPSYSVLFYHYPLLLRLFMSIISAWWKHHPIMCNLSISSRPAQMFVPISAQWIHTSSLKLATEGIFTSRKSGNATNQGSLPLSPSESIVNNLSAHHCSRSPGCLLAVLLPWPQGSTAERMTQAQQPPTQRRHRSLGTSLQSHLWPTRGQASQTRETLTLLTSLFTSLGRAGVRRLMTLSAKQLSRKESLGKRRRGERWGGSGVSTSPLCYRRQPKSSGGRNLPKAQGVLETGLDAAPEPGEGGGRRFSGTRAGRCL